MPPSWEQQRSKEDIMEDKIRDLMNKRRITYQEAEALIRQGQKSIFEF